jgi:hypothetical protein
LYIDGKPVAEQRLDKLNLIYSGENLSMTIGHAGGSRVSDAYDAPYAFSGTLKRLTIALDGTDSRRLVTLKR